MEIWQGIKYHYLFQLWTRVVRGVLLGSLISAPFFLCGAQVPAWAEVASGGQLQADGRTAFQRGDVETAVQHWQEAVRQYEQDSNSERLGNVLVDLAQAYQALGRYQEALQSLSRAQSVVHEPTQKAFVLEQVGNIYAATGAVAKAEQSLQESLGLAGQTNRSDLQAAILNDLGNLYTIQKRYDEALTAYRDGVKLAQNSGNIALAVRAQTNTAVALLQRGQYNDARSFLDVAATDIRDLPASHDTVYGAITIGMNYRTLGGFLPNARPILSQRAFETLSAAAAKADMLGDHRAASYAWGSLGTLYEDERRYAEALQLTQRAVFAAQQVRVPESQYRWQWQSGRLLKALGRRDEAVAAYRGAVVSLQSIRQEMAVQYGSTQTSFREAIGPVYFELVDLLLQQANGRDRDQEQGYLIEARATVELLRVAELRDYFRDECVDTVRSHIVPLEVVSQSAVVVYPILLSDRMELLVSLPGGLKRFVVPVGVAELTEEVRVLRRILEKRTTREYLPHAQRLYDWLIRPLETDLTAVSAETLVFVPDGPLRTIPMAALHDGKQFLVNKYALATTPGLDLTDPHPLPRENTQVFAAGLSAGVQGFAPLPYVSTELEAVQKIYGNTPLVNQAFQLGTVEKELKEKPFSIVHLASHGQFAGDSEKSFLLTFDDKLTIDRLGQAISFSRFRQAPLELLTLSACETAAGDDRAALGLAGVAIKAGARSAIATLWAVNDEAAALLMAEFYQQLQKVSLSKAQALRQAQIKLLNDRRFQHPEFWSPFLLLNNWL